MVKCDTTETTLAMSDAQPNDYFFEGAEKLLELWFEADDETCSLRNIERDKIKAILSIVNCRILHAMSNEHQDSYVLCQSSLFVSARRVILKTCGTTCLLAGLPHLVQAAALHGLRVETMFYSRKNWDRTQLQPELHRSFDTELAFLDKLFKDSSAYCMGSLKSDRWYLYTGSSTSRRALPFPDRTLELMMIGLSDAACNLYTQAVCRDGREAFKRGRLDRLVPSDAQIDDELFEPCGYSMNALMPDSDEYATVHITPEAAFSYASFETNQRSGCLYSLALRALNCFHPAAAQITVIANKLAAERAIDGSGWRRPPPGYRRADFQVVHTDDDDYVIIYLRLERTSPSAVVPPVKSSSEASEPSPASNPK